MNVYLLPHHRLDSRFRYTLERDVPANNVPALVGPGDSARDSAGLLQRAWLGFRSWVRRLKLDYDHVVHGHEQIRLSRLVLLMDRDPELTLVIPAGMTREWALQAVRGVIRFGLMAHRSHAIRNIVTALVMMIVLFGATPTHFAAIIFYPLIGLYAWGRYWEDRLIRRTMTHLLDVRLAGNGGEYFREEVHLTRLEENFNDAARPDTAYQAAVAYLDGLDHKQDDQAEPAYTLMFNYYRDIGRLDPYERYQDRIRQKLGETFKLVIHHLWAFWKAVFWWSLSWSRLGFVKIPNGIFTAAVFAGLGYLGVWYFTRPVIETPPKYVKLRVEFSKSAVTELRTKFGNAGIVARLFGRDSGELPANADSAFQLTCPLDSCLHELWPEVRDLATQRGKHVEGKLQCTGCDQAAAHEISYEIEITY